VVPDAPDAEGRAVSAELRHTPYHPRWYRRRVSVWWWLENPTYALFVVRELTSVAVAYFALLTLWQVRALAAGPAAHAAFLERMRSPGWLALNALALVSVVIHSVTWFNLAPKAMVLRLGGRRVPDALVAGANYAAWLVLSAGVLLLLGRA
jgi:fumarate reductase subunit C